MWAHMLKEHRRKRGCWRGRHTKPLPLLPFVYTLPRLPPSNSGGFWMMNFSPFEVTTTPSRYRT